MHRASVAKAHLDLGRVHIDVHQLGRDLQEERIGRLPAAVKLVFVRGADGVRHQAVAHEAAVDEQVLLVGAAARGLGAADAAGQRQRTPLHRQRAAGGHEVGAQHVAQSLRGGIVEQRRHHGAPLCHQPAFVPDRKAHVGPRQRMAAHGVQRMRQLGGVALQEFAPRRGVEEELAHLHRGAHAAGRGLQFAAAGVQPHRMRGTGGAAGDGHVGHRGDGGQRLAAKAHGRHRFQVGQAADLAGGVALQGQRQLVGRDAGTVVLDHGGAHAAAGQAHGDLPRTGIEGVVDQLAHHGGRALDHLAGGDLADQLVGQLADRAARDGKHGIHRRAF